MRANWRAFVPSQLYLKGCDLQGTEAELRGTIICSSDKYFRALLTECWWETEAALFTQNVKLSTNLEFISCSNTFPLEALNVDVAKLSQPVTHSAPGGQGRLEWAASTEWDKNQTQGVSEARAWPRDNPASGSWPQGPWPSSHGNTRHRKCSKRDKSWGLWKPKVSGDTTEVPCN